MREFNGNKVPLEGIQLTLCTCVREFYGNKVPGEEIPSNGICAYPLDDQNPIPMSFAC